LAVIKACIGRFQTWKRYYRYKSLLLILKREIAKEKVLVVIVLLCFGRNCKKKVNTDLSF